jgi:O-antigen/teichoic acid export membrane protein
MVGEVLGRASILGLTYFFILRQGGLWEFIAANVVGNVVLFIISYIFAYRYVKLWPRFQWKKWQGIIKETLPLAAVVLLNRVYFSIDTIFLSVFRTQQEVGIYGLPFKILDILISFPAIFAGLVFPSMARYGLKQFDELKRVHQKAFDFLVMIALPIFGGLVMLAKPVIDLLGGGEFGDSILILQVLSIAVVFIFFTTLLSNLVIAVKMQNKLMIVALICAVVNVALNIWLIPKYSYFAAAAVNVFTQFLVMLITGWFVWKYIKIVPGWQIFPKVILSVLAMVLVLYFVRDFNVFVATAIGGIVYLSVLYLTGGFSKEMVMNVLGKESSK